jgi:ketosteroid isomerase-like protein
MSELSSTPRDGAAWENEIRACEEEARAAFLAADLQTLDKLWADGYAVNSPLQQGLYKEQVLELLRSGRIRHRAYEIEIEHMSRHGDVVVVMGQDRVEDPPDGAVSKRRFTNVWQLENGVWRSIARHAHVVSREPAR